MKLSVLMFPKIISKGGGQSAYKTSRSGCFDIIATDYEIKRDPGRYEVSMGRTRMVVVGTELYLDQETSFMSRLMRQAMDAAGVVPILVIRSRSGLASKYNIQVLGGEIDADYPGEIKVMLSSNSNEDWIQAIKPGVAIAQARWVLSWKAPGVDTLEIKRTGGFGSTDK
jgi:dUTPase